MKRYLAAAAIGGLLIFAVQAENTNAPPKESAPEPVAALPAGERRVANWSDWTRPLNPVAAAQPAAASAPAASPMEEAADEPDVVDAHWMALTMWGEARSQGEEGMRAVGHVIRNRWLAGRGGRYVTGTVSEAWQFSCWNEGDPNRAAMLNIEGLPENSGDYRLWLAAKRLANDILSGRSADPTGGALFYHTIAVQPRWSAGMVPVAQIGSHLFFRTAR